MDKGEKLKTERERYSMDGNIASFTQGQCASPGLQYSTYPYQVPDGQSALAAYYAANQQLVPQGWLVNVLGQGVQPIGAAMSGAFGNPQLGSVSGGLGGQLPNFIPFSAAGQGPPQRAQPIGGALRPQTRAVPGSLIARYGAPYQLAHPRWRRDPRG